MLTSPNNPTGVCLTPQSLAAVAELAARHSFYVVCDDVYDQLVYAEGYEGFASLHPELREQTVVVNSFSKPYAMTGWRLGWLAAPAGAGGADRHGASVCDIERGLLHPGRRHRGPVHRRHTHA